MTEDEMVAYLEERGYVIKRPAREVNDEYTFENAWNIYDKKVGSKDKLKRKWNSMSKKDRKAATEYIPSYVLSKPDKQFRLNFLTYLNQKRWNDELIGATPPSTFINEQTSTTAQLIQKTKNDIEKDKTGQTFEEERKRLIGLVNTVRDNPQSFARKSLENYYNRGYLKKYGILWQP